MPFIISLIILLSAGGGISLAAEKSLPGDTLYPFKVHVNEEVRAQVAVDSQDEASWQVRRAERRLEEAEVLAARGDLNAENRASLEQSFNVQTKKAQEHIAKLEDSGKTDEAAAINAQLEASLHVHRSALASLAARADTDEEVDGELKDLAGNLEEKQEEVKSDRVRVETKIHAADKPDAQEAAEGNVHSAEEKISEVTKFIDHVKEKLGVEATVKAELQLAEANKSLLQAKAKLDAQAYAEAFALANAAHREAQAAKLLVELKKDVDVDVEAPMPPIIEKDVRPVPNMFLKGDEDQSIHEGDSIGSSGKGGEEAGGSGEAGTSGELHGHTEVNLSL